MAKLKIIKGTQLQCSKWQNWK